MASQSARLDTYTFEHHTLGSMTGLISPEVNSVVQFRAIPYATLPGRFKHSILRENLHDVSRDFTKQGFAFPHTFSTDDIHSGGPYPGAEPIMTSEFESFIVQVNVPISRLEAIGPHSTAPASTSSKLPVMTYIHGGGMVLGKIDPQHNTAYIVQHSINTSQPVITAAIQYRLGALGFLAIPDGDKNFALQDQRNALLWIQKFIGGFGGDASRTTVFGESAGGFSICLHMLSHLPSTGPLFSRAIIMSGIMGPLTVPQPSAEAEKVFPQILHILGIQETGEAGLQKLRSLDVQKLVDASDKWVSSGKAWPAIKDSELFTEHVTWDKASEALASCEWVEEIIVGNTGFEGTAYSSVAGSLTPQLLHDHIAQQVSPAAAEKTLEAYGITLEMDQNAFLTPAMRWFGESFFDAPVHAFSRNPSSKPVYRYIFDTRNPFPLAPFYQTTHHWVDVYFIFRTLQFRYPHAFLKDISDKHAALWIDFVNGKAPWRAYDANSEGGGVVMVADEREGWVEKTLDEYQCGSRDGRDFGRLEKLWESWAEKEGQWFLPLDMAGLKNKTKFL